MNTTKKIDNYADNFIVGRGGVEAGARKVHVSSPVDDSHPLAVVGAAGQAAERNLSGFWTALQRLVARTGEDEHGFADAVPGVVGEDNAGAFG